MSTGERELVERLKKGLLVISKLRAEKDELERFRREPVAVVGIGCRFPGRASTPEAFWELLRDGVDTVTEVPPSRWDLNAYYDPDPEAPGKMYTRQGAFLDRIDSFDPQFFGISAREARSMDPQQRLMLEVAWETLERAGYAPGSLKNSRTGVFIGSMANEYAMQAAQASDVAGSDIYLATGGGGSFLAGRLSYQFGFQGPCMPVDTACSSSLVTVHLAIQSLRKRECDLALAGGVNVILSPEMMVLICKMRALAPDGRCKAFDASADGYGRGEGCGLVALRRLSDAVAAGDPILAVIRGSGFNHDGPSSALTVPNAQAQQDVIRQALEDGRVDGRTIRYVEAHGTGTRLGDPIELRALWAALGPGRSQEQELVVGSVKTNIGHLEGAAGIAGLIKVILALQHQEIPKQLHLNTLNPFIASENLPIRIATENIPWPRDGAPRLAGVSTFGLSGINAHVIVEEAPLTPAVPIKDHGDCDWNLLTLSARSLPALKVLAKEFGVWIEKHPEAALADVCFTANMGRSHFEHRAALVVRTADQALTQLGALARDEGVPGLFRSGEDTPLGDTSSPVVIQNDAIQSDAIQSGARQRFEALAELYVSGRIRAFRAGDLPAQGRKLTLPTYPFERQRYWVESASRITVPAVVSDAVAEDKTHQWFHQISWLKNPTGAPGIDLAFTDRIEARVQRNLPAFLSRNSGELYVGLTDQLDALSLAYILAAFAQLGWEPKPAEPVIVEDLAARLKVSNTFRPLFGRLLNILEEDGILKRTGPGWEVSRVPETPDPLKHRTLLLSRYPAAEIELNFIHRCGSRLAEVLRGECDPLELLFAGGSLADVEHVYERSPLAQLCNRIVEEVVATAAESFPAGGPDRVLRVLEIGAGTGGTTASVLRGLPASRTDYVFSDVSRLFLAQAGDKFSASSFIRFEVLDIERDPETQGLRRHSFDLIVAANVLHATADLRQTLRHVRQLLAPGGVLVLLEGTTPQRWMDLTFGLTEGWWRFTDKALRPDYPLLPRDRWLALLREEGFHQPRAIGGTTNDPAALSRQTVLVASAHAEPAAAGRSWLIFADREGVGNELAKQLRARDQKVRMVRPGTGYSIDADGVVRINPADPHEFHRLLADIGDEDHPGQSSAMLHLWGLDGTGGALSAESLDAVTDIGCRSVLSLVQAILKAEHAAPWHLWIATRGACPVGEERLPDGTPQALLWGLGQTFAAEHPSRWGGLVDLDPKASAEEQASELLAQIDWNDREKLAVFRAGERYVPRLVRRPVEINGNASWKPRPDATYLITGGLGAIGLAVAGRLVERGARSLVLLGRSGATDAAERTIEHLRQSAQVVVSAVDVTSREQIERCLDDIRRSLPPLRGVFHAAGRFEEKPLVNQDWGGFAAVLSPKVRGAWNLHDLTQGLDLDLFVLFSSASSFLGPSGLGPYAAGNVFLDALAHHRKYLGLPAMSVDWGPWDQLGMLQGLHKERLEFWRTSGVEPLRTDQGLQALDSLLSSPAAQIAVLPIDWSKYLGMFRPGDEPPLLTGLLSEVHSAPQPADSTRGPGSPGAAKAGADGAFVARILAAEPPERPAILHAHLRRRIAATLGSDEQSLPAKENLLDLGLDSLMLVELLNALKKDLQLPLYPRELYARPQLPQLAKYLVEELERVHGLSANDLEKTAESLPLTLPSSSLTRASAPARRNPSMIFVLSSPRAGSTLLRVMLQGHPALFAPPELHLLNFSGMREREQTLGSRFLGEGLYRALMELKGLAADESKAIVDEWVARDLAVQEVYGTLQELAGERLLVDKTPSYALDPRTLEMAEQLFERPRYIALVRHPYSVIESFVRMRMDRLLGVPDADPFDLAEKAWAATTRNVLAFFEGIDPERRHLLRYEDLVRDPAGCMAAVCEFLRVPYDPALLTPYVGPRMTDGIHPHSLPISDPNFMQHTGIDAGLGEAWKKVELPRRLSAETRGLAAELGYELPHEGAVELQASDDPMPMDETFVDVRGLRICMCGWGPEAGPLVLCLHGILEQGAAWDAVAQTLARSGYRVLAPDQRGHGRSDHVPESDYYHLLDFVADADGLLRRFNGKPVTLVGHSMGAMLAMMVAGARPEQVRALVLVEMPLPGGARDDEFGDMIATYLDYAASPLQHPVLPDETAAVSRLRRATPALTGHLAKLLAARSTERCPGGWRWLWDPRLRSRTGMVLPGRRDQDLLQLLLRVKAPITMVYGDASGLVRPEQKDMLRQGLPQARHIVLPGTHSLHIDAAADLSRIVEQAARSALVQPSRST